MKFVIPARKWQIKYLINKLEKVINRMSLSIRLFSFILNNNRFGFLLFFNHIDDYFLKAFVANSHKYLTKLLQSLVDLIIFENIFTYYSLISWDWFENVQDIWTVRSVKTGIPNQLQKDFQFLLHYFDQIG